MHKKITTSTLHSFCRTCLNELQQPHMYNIHKMDVQIRHWLQSPVTDDAYPTYVCHLCREKLEYILEFHQMCSRSRKVFQGILAKTCNRQMQENDGSTTWDGDYGNEVQINCDWLNFDFDAVPQSMAESEMYKRQAIKNEQSTTTIPSTFSNNDENSKDNENTDEDNLSLSSSIHIKDEEHSFDDNYQWTSSEDSIVDKSSSGKPSKSGKKGSRTCKSITVKRKISKYKFRCDQCHKLCLNQQTLDTHKRIHQGLMPSQCPKCHRSFHSARYLRVHLNEFHKKINIKCEYEGCGKEFRRTCTYRHHVRYKHVYVDKQNAKPKKPQQTQHVCEECGKVYAQLYNLQVHLYSHKPKEDYPFQCPQCDKRFPCHIRLKRHELTHSDIKNYECPHCGLKKRNIYALKAHINCHTKERTWNCTKCDMVFTSAEGVRSHDKVVHLKLRPYSCSYCEQTFATSDALKHHEMRHTGEKPHICSECGKRFIQLVALRTHMKTHNILLPKRKTTLKIVKPEEKAKN